MDFEGEKIIKIVVVAAEKNKARWLVTTTQKEYTDGVSYKGFREAWQALVKALEEGGYYDWT